MPTSSPLHQLVHMGLQGQGRCPPPCEASLPAGTARLPQSATPQPSTRHSPAARCLGTGRSRQPGPCRRLPAEAPGRTGSRQSWPQIPRADTGTRKEEIAPFQHQAAGLLGASCGRGTQPTPVWDITLYTPPCPALSVGPTSTHSLPAATSPCPAPRTLLPQLLGQLVP